MDLERQAARGEASVTVTRHRTEVVPTPSYELGSRDQNHAW
jgi:hypothetical protein